MLLVRFCPRIEERVVFVSEMSRFLSFSIYARIKIKREAFIP